MMGEVSVVRVKTGGGPNASSAPASAGDNRQRNHTSSPLQLARDHRTTSEERDDEFQYL